MQSFLAASLTASLAAASFPPVRALQMRAVELANDLLHPLHELPLDRIHEPFALELEVDRQAPRGPRTPLALRSQAMPTTRLRNGSPSAIDRCGRKHRWGQQRDGRRACQGGAAKLSGVRAACDILGLCAPTPLVRHRFVTLGEYMRRALCQFESRQGSRQSSRHTDRPALQRIKAAPP